MSFKECLGKFSEWMHREVKRWERALGMAFVVLIAILSFAWNLSRQWKWENLKGDQVRIERKLDALMESVEELKRQLETARR